MMVEPATAQGSIAFWKIFSVIFLTFASVVGIWIRELVKNKNQKSNGADLKEIKADQKTLLTTVATIDKNVGMVQTDVKAMKAHCEKTTKRFEKGIDDNRKEILDLTKEMK